MPIQGNLTAMFQKRSLYISVPPNISVKVSYWFPGYFPLIPFYEMWKITGTPLNPSLSSRDRHQQEPVTFFKLSHGFWEEPRSISKGVEQAPLSKESWELAMQVCAFVSFEWETFWITGNILTFFFFQKVGEMVGELSRGHSVWSWGLGELPTGFHTWCAQQTKRWTTAKAAGHLSLVMRPTASVSALNETLRWDLNRSHFHFRSDQSHSFWFGCKSSNQSKPIIWSTR